MTKNKGDSLKFVMEKFNGKGNFFMRQRRVKIIQVKEGLYKAIAGKDKKSTKISEDE